MSFMGRVDKPTVVHSYHGVLLHNKKKQIIDIYYNLGESPENYTNEKKKIANSQSLHTV